MYLFGGKYLSTDYPKKLRYLGKNTHARYLKNKILLHKLFINMISAICGYLVSCTLSYGGENRCYVIVSVFHNPDYSIVTAAPRLSCLPLSRYWIVMSKVNTSSCVPSFTRQPQPSEVSIVKCGDAGVHLDQKTPPRCPGCRPPGPASSCWPPPRSPSPSCSCSTLSPARGRAGNCSKPQCPTSQINTKHT